MFVSRYNKKTSETVNISGVFEMEYNFKLIGRIIVKEREKRGWSQSELIERASQYVPIARNRLSALENGKAKRCDLFLLTALCNLFQCEMGYLLGETELPTKVDEVICQETGLDYSSSKALQTAKKEHWFFVNKALNEMLQYDTFRLLDLIGQYITMDEHDTVELNDGEKIDKGVLYARKIEHELVKLRRQVQQKERGR